MATYEKLTLQRFMDSLKAGKYESLTGARRAIGRVDWTEKDKKAAQGLAEKYFGGAAAPAPKKQPAKKVPAAKKSAPVQTTAAPARQPRAKAATTERNFSHVEKLKARSGGVDKLDHTKELIGVVSTALTSLGQVKAAEQTLDITEAQDGINYLTKMIRLLDQQTKTLNL